jgi:CDP-diacylglycerol---serine O-phosphatidyltransferase
VTDRWRVSANGATLANAVLGGAAIVYTYLGNPIWAMLLIAIAIGFDGLDGMLSRRSGAPASSFGRIADSVADGITFGLAPAFLIGVHTVDPAAWAAWAWLVVPLAVAYAAAALVRLTLFTALLHDRPYFLGVPTPEAALAVIAALLAHDVPAFQSVQPLGVSVGVAAITVLMLVPIPYPKIRRGTPLRLPMALTAAAAAVALVPLQFRPAPGTPLYLVAEVAALVLLVGVASYYLLGPFTVRRDRPSPA